MYLVGVERIVSSRRDEELVFNVDCMEGRRDEGETGLIDRVF
jgi:hypothetical protein